METNYYYAILFLIVLILFIIAIYNNKYTKKENFIDKYYDWDWNDPDLIGCINLIDKGFYNYGSGYPDPGPNATYSMSCDFTDDAQDFCYRTLDVPKTDNLMGKNQPRTNSY